MSFPISVRRAIWNRLIQKLETLMIPGVNGGSNRLTVLTGIRGSTDVKTFPTVIVFPPEEIKSFSTSGYYSTKDCLMSVEIQGFSRGAGGQSCVPGEARNEQLDQLMAAVEAAVEGVVPLPDDGSAPELDQSYDNKTITVLVAEVSEFPTDNPDTKGAFYMRVEFYYRHRLAAPWKQCD